MDTLELVFNFGLDGTQYEIDLSDTNAKKLHDALDPWVKLPERLVGAEVVAVAEQAAKQI